MSGVAIQNRAATIKIAACMKNTSEWSKSNGFDGDKVARYTPSEDVNDTLPWKNSIAIYSCQEWIIPSKWN